MIRVRKRESSLQLLEAVLALYRRSWGTHAGSGKSHTMGTASTSGHAGPAFWPHAVIQNAARGLFIEAALRSGAVQLATQPTPAGSDCNAEDALEHSKSPLEDHAAALVAAEAGSTLASSDAATLERPALSEPAAGRPGSSSSSGTSSSTSDRSARHQSWNKSHAPPVTAAFGPANAAGAAAASDVAWAELAEDMKRRRPACTKVEVHMSMWQIYKDSAQDLLAPDTPTVRGRSMEGLHRIRVTSGAEVEARPTPDSGGLVTSNISKGFA